MNTTSKQVELELNQTTKRLDELTAMQTGINANLQTLQQGFIDGNISLDDLQIEQGKLTILNESIKALEAKQENLHAAFQRTSLFESRQETISRLKTISSEADAAFNEYLQLRAKLVETCRTVGEKMVDALILSRHKQAEFESAFQRLAPGVYEFRPTLEQKESFDRAKAELMENGFTYAAFNNLTSSFRAAPPTDFPEAVHFVEQTIGNNGYRRTSQAAKA